MDLKNIDSLPYFLDVFEQNVKNDPDCIMLVDEKHKQRMTRAEADDISGRVYAWLTKQGIGRGDVVSVLIDKSEYTVIASLGVLKSGAAYQPLDPSYPG